MFEGLAELLAGLGGSTFAALGSGAEYKMEYDKLPTNEIVEDIWKCSHFTTSLGFAGSSWVRKRDNFGPLGQWTQMTHACQYGCSPYLDKDTGMVIERKPLTAQSMESDKDQCRICRENYVYYFGTIVCPECHMTPEEARVFVPERKLKALPPAKLKPEPAIIPMVPVDMKQPALDWLIDERPGE